jgi:hypothetical protein
MSGGQDSRAAPLPPQLCPQILKALQTGLHLLVQGCLLAAVALQGLSCRFDADRRQGDEVRPAALAEGQGRSNVQIAFEAAALLATAASAPLDQGAAQDPAGLFGRWRDRSAR